MNAHHPKLDVGAANWLGLAAAPTFAIMALLTLIFGDGMPNMLCSGTQDALPLTGMAPMYVLMSVFHSVPWLKLISGAVSAG
jgi:CBS domain containing-hemolysin-like protein